VVRVEVSDVEHRASTGVLGKTNTLLPRPTYNNSESTVAYTTRKQLLDLPAELLIQIVKGCVEYDLPYNSANDSKNDYREFQASKTDYQPNDAKRTAWLTISRPVKKDICNSRLVCRELRNAAYDSFGLILGDRRFRMSEIGFADLKAIGALSALTPWIKTLTFGCAQLQKHREPQCYKKYLLESWDKSESQAEVDNRVADIEKAWQSFKEFSALDSSVLTRLLTRFPKLENVRISLTDRVD
jgi:hypothetical protein